MSAEPSNEIITPEQRAQQAAKDARGAVAVVGCAGVFLLLATATLLLWSIWGESWHLAATGAVAAWLYTVTRAEAVAARQRLHAAPQPPPAPIVRGGWDG